MKVSLNLIKFFNAEYKTGYNPYDEGVENVINRIGLQLGAIESVSYTGEKYEGIVVASVVSCEKHQDADKLHVCFIDDGGVVPDVDRDDNGHVQVVCGAPNVSAGMTVAWIPPGATVPSTVDKDPFVLESRELRGKVSNGMLASPKELGLGDDHSGILEINPGDVGEDFCRPGTTFKQLYGLDDVVIDCENKMFTHRPDCFGVLGVARELAGIFDKPFVSPAWYTQPLPNEVTSDLPLEVNNGILELVPRFMVQVVSDVKVGSSPMWLQSYLARVGLKSINNVVDYTNFFMMETGQPLHAFDYDKLLKYSTNPTLQPRLAKKGEKILLLGGKEVVLTEEDIVIATDKKAVALAGVMGGAETEVDEHTTRVVIECANFDMYTIRRTSMRHGLFTDAVTRFNKGQSPLQNDRVLAKMVNELVKKAGGKVASKAFDLASFDPAAENLNHVSVSASFINDRLGSKLTGSDMKRLLENVEFSVALQGDNLHITVPFWRMDIAIAEDIVEEIGRLYGYDKLPVELPARPSKPAPVNRIRSLKATLRNQLKLLGANEVLTYSFVHGGLLAQSGINPDEAAYHLRNALSPGLQYYRPSLQPSLADKIYPNIKAQAGAKDNVFALFEIGKVHIKGLQEEEEPLPKQLRHLAFMLAADAKTSVRFAGSPYYHAKKYLDELTNKQATYTVLDSEQEPLASMFQPGRSALVSLGDEVLGTIGEYKRTVRKRFKLPDYCAGFEIDLDVLSRQLIAPGYEPLSAFPTTQQDITLEIKETIQWADVHRLLAAELAVIAAEDGYVARLQPLDIFQEQASDKKRLSFRIELAHYQKTLRTEEVNAILDKLAEAAGEKLHAVRI